MHAKYDVSLSSGSNIISRDVVVVVFFFFAIDRTTKTLTAPNFIQEARHGTILITVFHSQCWCRVGFENIPLRPYPALITSKTGNKIFNGSTPNLGVRLNMQSPSFDHRIFSKTSYWCKDLYFTFKAAQSGFENYTNSQSESWI